MATSNASGDQTAASGYSPYGEPSAWSGSRYAYTGQLMIPENSLYNYKARAYDPRLGRFLQSDPLGYAADINAYEYAGGNPVVGADPMGTDATTDPIVILAIPKEKRITVNPGDFDLGGDPFQLGLGVLSGGDGGAFAAAPNAGGTPAQRSTGTPQKPDKNVCPVGSAEGAATLGGFVVAGGISAQRHAMEALYIEEILEAGGTGAVLTSETGPGAAVGFAIGAAVGVMIYIAEKHNGC